MVAAARSIACSARAARKLAAAVKADVRGESSGERGESGSGGSLRSIDVPRGELWLGVGSRRRSPLSERDHTRGVVGTTASAVVPLSLIHI